MDIVACDGAGRSNGNFSGCIWINLDFFVFSGWLTFGGCHQIVQKLASNGGSRGVYIGYIVINDNLYKYPVLRRGEGSIRSN